MTIAVVIINHNQCDNLKAAIGSVIKQSRQPDQIVVLDDGSEDETAEFLEELKKALANFQFQCQPHAGIGAARKAATKLAKCDIIAVLDSDDLFLPQALAHYETFFQRHPELDLAYGNVAVVNSNGAAVTENRYRSFKSNEEMKKAIFISPKVPFKHSAIAFKGATYDDVGGYDEHLKIKVDIDLVLRFIAHHKKIMHLDEVIAKHRIHQNNISRNRLAGLKQWYRFIFKYENNFLRRVNFIFIRTGWELSKLLVEAIRNFTMTAA